jgi:hypothetical protein
LEASGKSTRPSGKEIDGKSQRKLRHLLSYYKEVNIGPCGGVDPLQNEKRKQPVREVPVVEAPVSIARMNEGRINMKRECETTHRPKLDHASARGEHHWRKGRMRRKEHLIDIANRTPGTGMNLRLFGTNSLKKGAV